MQQIVYVILPIFIIIFGSAFLTRLKIADKSWMPVLNAFALKIGFPALIFSALSTTTFDFAKDYPLLLVNTLFILATFALTWMIGKAIKLNKKFLRTIFICLVLGNVAFLGIPVLTQIYGPSILPTASLIVAVYLFWYFTAGVGFLDSTQDGVKPKLGKLLKHVLENPLLIAVILGLIFSGLNIPIPEMIATSISMLAASVTPVVLVVIGLFLGDAKFGKIKDWINVGIFSFLTLVINPLLLLGILWSLNMSFQLFASSIVDAAMPLAITPFALADKYNLDKKFIANSIVLSTVLSIITIPLWINLLSLT